MKKTLLLTLICGFTLVIGHTTAAAQTPQACPYCADHQPVCQYSTRSSGGCFCHWNGKKCSMTGHPCSCSSLTGQCTCTAADVQTQSADSTLEKEISLAKKHDTVESVRAFWVEEFKNDPPGQTEVFHVGGTGCVRQEIYVVGMTQAAIDTGHPIKFTQSTDDETPER